MAEINVQRKKPSAWLWILGVLAAVGFVWVLVTMSRDDDFDTASTSAPAAVPSARDTAATSGTSGAPAPEVAAFLTFAEAPVASPVGPGHEYAADGIRRLTRALNAVIEKQTVAGNPVRDQLAAFRAKADQIQADPQATGHAEQVRDVFTSAADLMSAVQKEQWPEAADLRAQIAEVRAAGAGIDAARPLLDQTPKVKAFFDRAAAALRVMSVSPAGRS